MERERYGDDDLVEREIEERTQSPEPADDTEFERRTGPDVLRNVEPAAPRERAEAVYGDTDMDPNRDDQKSAHSAQDDEHL